MPTYDYETIPSGADEEPRRFTVFEKMNDERLTTDPETGLQVKRIITGGVVLRNGVLRRSTVVDKKSPAATACGCATGRPHRHGRNDICR